MFMCDNNVHTHIKVFPYGFHMGTTFKLVGDFKEISCGILHAHGKSHNKQKHTIHHGGCIFYWTFSESDVDENVPQWLCNYQIYI